MTRLFISNDCAQLVLYHGNADGELWHQTASCSASWAHRTRAASAWYNKNQWLYKKPHGLVMTLRDLGFLPILTWTGCAITAGSPAVCPASASLGRHDSAVRLSSRCVCKKRTAQRTEWKALSYQCCKLFLQQEMEHYKYLINVQRIALKFEHSHSFSMSFSVFWPVPWRQRDLQGKVVEIFSCWNCVHL